MAQGVNYVDQIAGHGENARVDFRDPSKILMEIEDGDDGETIDCAGIAGIPRDALKKILDFVCDVRASGGTAQWRCRTLRLAALAHLANVQGVGEKTLTQLAGELGCTRASVSLYSIRIVDQLHQYQVRGGKRREAREAYRESAIRSHRAAGHVIKE